MGDYLPSGADTFQLRSRGALEYFLSSQPPVRLLEGVLRYKRLNSTFFPHSPEIIQTFSLLRCFYLNYRLRATLINILSESF